MATKKGKKAKKVEPKLPKLYVVSWICWNSYRYEAVTEDKLASKIEEIKTEYESWSKLRVHEVGEPKNAKVSVIVD